MSSFSFDSETAAEATGDGSWSAMVSDRWNIGDTPNGGYLLSVAMLALADMADHLDPITVTAHFLRPGLGRTEGLVRGEVAKHGRVMTTVRGSLEQEGKLRMEVLAGFGDLSTGASGREFSYSAPEMPPPEECVARGRLEQGVDIALLERVDVRIHPGQADAGLSPNAVVSGWIRFSDGREPDSMALPLFADAFPPSVFALYGYIGWVPTLELTVQVRRRPEPGWVLARFETDDLRNGLFVETGSLWDSTGALIARSRQLAMLRST